MLKSLSLVFVMLLLFGCEEQNQFSIEQLDEYRYSQDLVYLAQFSSDSEQLLVVDEKRLVSIWQLSTKKKVFTLPPSKTPEDLRAVYFKKSENLLLLSGQNYIDFWDIKLKSKIGSLKVFSDEPLAKISSINVSQYAGVIAVGMTDGTVFLYNRASNSSVKKIIHDGTVNHIHFLSADRYLLTSGTDGQVIKSAVSNLEETYSKQLKNRVSTLVIDQSSNKSFVSDVLDKQMFFMLDNGKSISEINYTARFRWFRLGEFYGEGEFLITTTPKTDISLWDVSSGNELFTWNSKTLSLGSTNLDLMVNKNKILTFTSEGVYQVWDLTKE